LFGAHQRACDENVERDAERGEASCHARGAADALVRERPVKIGAAPFPGVFGRAMSDEVAEHSEGGFGQPGGGGLRAVYP
jgi:hypothetical protein